MDLGASRVAPLSLAIKELELENARNLKVFCVSFTSNHVR